MSISWAFGLFAVWGFCEQWCYEYSGDVLCGYMFSILFSIVGSVDVESMVTLCLRFQHSPSYFPKGCTSYLPLPTMNESCNFPYPHSCYRVSLITVTLVNVKWLWGNFLIITNPSPSLCPSVLGWNSNSFILGATGLCQEEKNERIWIRVVMTKRECWRNVRGTRTRKGLFWF